MRVDFVKAVGAALKSDPSAVFVTGDLGFNALEEIRNSLGPRFINAGVAEQNMVGLAAGIALTGFSTWVYSIAPFATYRCLEQIRNDVCLHRLPVRLVGNGGGYTYGIMGSTHHALEDVACLKALPNLRLFLPGTNRQVAGAVEQMSRLAGPGYLRLGISGFPSNRAPISETAVTQTAHYHAGDNWTVIGVGQAIQPVLVALEQHGLEKHRPDVYGLSQFPFDLNSDASLVESVRRTQKVLVIEEHYLPGSLAESLSLALPKVERFEVMSANYKTDQKYGSSQFHLKQCGMTPQNIVARVA
jgi:transketolase